MKLIDAKEVWEELEGMYRETRDTDEAFLAGKADGFWDARCVVEEAVAVDAIPVSWLREQREGMERAEQDFPEQAIRYVLWLWEKRKEQQ